MPRFEMRPKESTPNGNTGTRLTTESVYDSTVVCGEPPLLCRIVLLLSSYSLLLILSSPLSGPCLKQCLEGFHSIEARGRNVGEKTAFEWACYDIF